MSLFIKRRGGGLKLSPRVIRDHVRFGAKLPAGPDVVEVSHLKGVHVGDDQGVHSSCTVVSGIKLDEMHGSNVANYSDAECLAAYLRIIQYLGRKDEGLTPEEAFDGLQREGFLKWAKAVEQVYDFSAMEEGPLWYAMVVTPGIQATDENGCPDYSLPDDDLGLHMVVLGAVGPVVRYGGKTILDMINSWSLSFGFNGMFQIDQGLHDRVGYGMYRMVPR